MVDEGDALEEEEVGGMEADDGTCCRSGTDSELGFSRRCGKTTNR